MSRFMHGDSVQVMGGFPDKSIDFILTDPPYLVGFKDRSGRSIANDVNSEWVQPASNEMFRMLKDNSLAVSFYGWNRIDIFMQALKAAGFRVVGHIVFTKPYASKSAFVGYQHESAYVLAKGRPAPADCDLHAARRHCSGPVCWFRFDLRGRPGLRTPLDWY